MVAKIIDGHAVARQVRQECRELTDTLKARGVTPGLAVIIVGDNPASKVYVANKVKACTEVGLDSTVYAFAADTPDQEVLDKILRYETKLERQMYRAMAQLERLQRMRQGEAVPAPLSVVSEGA